MTRRQRILARIIFFLYIVNVAWLCFGNFSSVPDVPKDFWGIPMDKIVHFLMFFPFPLLAFLAFDQFTNRFLPSLLWTLATFLAGSLFAAFTEYVQAKFLPYRMGDFADFKADLLALGISSVLVFVIDLLKQRKS